MNFKGHGYGKTKTTFDLEGTDEMSIRVERQTSGFGPLATNNYSPPHLNYLQTITFPRMVRKNT